MPTDSVSITGFPELLQKLKDLESIATEKQVLVKGVRAGAKKIQEEAARLAPVRFGGLSKSIIITQAGEGNTVDEVRFKIGPDRPHFYGLFVEKGTAHMTAKPFLAPAAESQREEAIAEVVDVLKKAIQKVAR